MNEELVKHKHNLITIYGKNLQSLEIRQAEGSFDLSIVNQIENIKNMILQLEEEIANLTSTASSTTYTLQSIPFPLQKYETLVTRFTEELGGWNGEASRYQKSILISLKRALGAKYVFSAKHVDGDWAINADYEDTATEVVDLIKQPGSLREVLLQSQKRSELALVTLGNPAKVSLLLPVTERLIPEILVFYEVKDEFEYDKGMELILQTIIQRTKGLNSPIAAEQLEMMIYNELRKSFGYVSDYMYNRQFYLFNSQLEGMTVQFEPIIFLSPTAPSIFGWEALAREPKTLKVPADLLETAELWGTRFQLQLDMYFLKLATDVYVTGTSDKSAKKIRRKHTILPLSVNVHPTTLLRTRFYETIKKIEELGQMPLNKLYLEISEKAPIPLVDNWDGIMNPTDAYREFLYKYRDLDIHFSVDDFGVGFASSSRVSRIGPAFIKIDRDALLDNFGNFTMEYVIRLAKRMPGEMSVIVEGYDKESKFDLRRLYELGVRYIQGHKYGLTTAQIDDRLSSNTVQDICRALTGLE